MPDPPGKKPAGAQLSRLDRYKRDKVQPDMPPIDGGEYLINYFWEVGPVIAGMDGPVVISQAEIRAWQENAGIDLQPWQAGLLRRLSQDYLAQSHAAKDSACKPPYGELYRSPNLSKLIDAALD
ncbi:hypothetical protein CR152_10230 [Massilia violaceinigra]|uniref:Uncharacterized protein n=1 Tax=Massilia violaceinigra TaxID=2045208 RepID=A0A2D2DIQ1_9BURK|nr:hypothetical protein [Massilia violaceinigra]ATQ74858.1 hypothetical protein CR152_10230 [Massilia violaceinigra]